MLFADLHEAELRERGEEFNETLLLEKRYTTANSVGAFPLLLQYVPCWLMQRTGDDFGFYLSR